jgi:uncharacterized protein YbjT (DUF2867 family)
MKTAIIIGATGLVGSDLTRQLLVHPDYSKVIVFVRHATGLTDAKLTERIVDFEQIETWKEEIRGDVLFSALGTTLDKAGSKQAQYRVDYTFQYQVAAAAATNGVPCLVLISAAGASERSMIFYSRMKGELDRDVKKLPFQRLRIIKPGILKGTRVESRPTEEISIRAMQVLGKLPLIRKYRPVPATTVATAMIKAAAMEEPGFRKFELEEVFTLARQ